MPLLTDRERAFARGVARLADANPFLPERIEAERQTLGDAFTADSPMWHAQARPGADTANGAAIRERARTHVRAVRERLAAGRSADPEDAALYADVALYVLFCDALADLQALVDEPKASTARVPAYARFADGVAHYLSVPGLPPAAREEPAHLWALFFQVRRAFHLTFTNILGGSLTAARLRAAVWQSLFTHDPRRYRRGLHARMRDITTLVTGPSGTGKELVARAIGGGRYVPFDPGRQAFVEDYTASFFPLHLAALPATLVESELFGHRRGAFTGAVQDRAGWLESCPAHGTVFLDEIGELEPALQVKLLRVLQERTFHRIGDTRERRFAGKLIAATNRDLATEIQAGRFREDLYYRLCADVIETPSLAAQLREAPDDLGHLLRLLAARVAGEEEAAGLAAETERWIRNRLGADYPWPGNVRELEQCLRNVLVRGAYRPRREAAPASAADGLLGALRSGPMTAEELVRRYAAVVFRETGSYQETARRLGLDRRTVKAKLGGEGPGEAENGETPPENS